MARSRSEGTLLLPRQLPGPTGIAEILSRGAEDIVAIQLSDPPVGKWSTVKVPGDYWWRPLIVTFVLRTSATAATRFPVIFYRTAEDVDIVTAGFGPGQGASLTFVHTFSTTMPIQMSNTAVKRSVNPLVDTILSSGSKIAVAVDSLQADDRIFNIVIVIERYSTAPSVFRAPLPPLIAARVIEQRKIFLGPVPEEEVPREEERLTEEVE